MWSGVGLPAAVYVAAEQCQSCVLPGWSPELDGAEGVVIPRSLEQHHPPYIVVLHQQTVLLHPASSEKTSRHALGQLQGPYRLFRAARSSHCAAKWQCFGQTTLMLILMVTTFCEFCHVKFQDILWHVSTRSLSLNPATNRRGLHSSLMDSNCNNAQSRLQRGRWRHSGGAPFPMP